MKYQMKSSINIVRNALASIVMMAAMLVPAAAMAQESTVTGTVTDEIDEPLPGVLVTDKDNKHTTLTDVDGNYTLSGITAGTEIKVSFLGYKPQTATWNGTGRLDFKLVPDVQMLEETVVIGYATVKKKDLTGAVGAIGGERLSQQRTPNLSSALQGAIPGLDVTRSGSMPGAGSTVRVRGITTMSDNSPLILVDGSPVSSLDNVNVDDVESISVLKDAAAASIYGARAAAGVIIVTTKTAKDGDVRLTYNGEFSLMHASSFPEFITDPVTYMNMYNEMKWNDAGNPAGGEYPVYTREYIDTYYENSFYDPIEYPVFNWRDNILRSTAPRHKHNVSLSYGNKTVKTRISVSYENTEALYEGSNYERVFVRANNSINFSPNWTATVDLSMKHGVKNDPHSGSPIRAALMYPELFLGMYPDGRIAGGKQGSNTLGAAREGGEKKKKDDYLTGKISLTYKPFDFLSIQASVNPTMTFINQKDMRKAVPYYDAYDTGERLGYVSGYVANSLTETRVTANSLEKSLVATYNQDFGPHALNAMVGYEDYSYTYETMSASSEEMTLSDYPYLDLANKNNLSVGGSSFQNAYRSFFGRVMYNFNHRYFIQANIRGDGSSRFASDCRWGWFPSASIGWRMSEEHWMEGIADKVSNLMIRGSYGSLGNERIGNYPYQASIDIATNVMFGPNGSQALTSAAQRAYAVRNITWESTHTWDIGIDLSMFNSRFELTADYYYKKTKDMLLAMTIPGFLGYDAPDVNAGDMNTRGWEVKLSWNDNIGRDWTYGVGFNISDSRSKMGNLNGKIMYDGDYIIREGDEYKAFYGLRSDGLYQTEEEIQNSAKLVAGVRPGDVRYRDLTGPDGEPDGKIDNTYDREVLGSSLPHLLYGGYINVGWKGIRLSAAFNGVGRQKVRMSNAMVQNFGSSWLSCPELLRDNYWSVNNTPEQNLAVRFPRLTDTNGEANNYKMSDYWLMNGAYFRMKNINLSYTFPSQIVQRLRLKNLRVYFNVEDPFRFSHYPKGWDPEANSSGSNYIATTYTFGLDFSF